MDPILAVLAAAAIPAIGGTAALLASRTGRSGALLGAGGALAGCAVGILPAARAALGADPSSLSMPWSLPAGAFAIGIDALSAWFLVPIFIVAAAAAVYGAGYMKGAHGGGIPGVSWFFFDLLLSGMILVVVARDGLLFLMAWEVMTLSSFFLVTQDDRDPAARRAGWTYLVASQIGTAFLLALFILLGAPSGSLEFDRIAAFGAPAPAAAGVLFALALIGFGTKAGLVPLHVWLPEAHPAAPSHVSAVMSGVMIKTGIYGLLRVLTLLGPPPGWWGWVLVAAGLVSALLGVLFALAQRDLKRMLAYSSVENVGLITIAVGLGVLGSATGSPALAVLGLGGALFHVLNHAIFKGLLFLGAGAVARGASTRDMERLGGLHRTMPRTSLVFLTGSGAIAALPPLNGFGSEFLIYLAAFHGALSGGFTIATPSLAAIAGLALAGGLVAACFIRAFGCVFLGEPRAPLPGAPRDPSAAMMGPLAALAALCLAAGLLSPLIAGALGPAILAATPLPAPVIAQHLAPASAALRGFVVVSVVLAALTLLLAALRARILARRTVAGEATWDCGFASPSPRMQYTASSFAQPLSDLFAPLLRTRRRGTHPRGLFPGAASFTTHAPDHFHESLYAPLFSGAARGLARLRWLQGGQVRVYVAYIALTLLVLLLWKVR